jgi:hypothetical protein
MQAVWRKRLRISGALFFASANDLQASGLEGIKTRTSLSPTILPACGSWPVALIFDIPNPPNARETGE